MRGSRKRGVKAQTVTYTPRWEKPALQHPQLSSTTPRRHAYFTVSPHLIPPRRCTRAVTALGHSPLSPGWALVPETHGGTCAIHAWNHSAVIWLPSLVDSRLCLQSPLLRALLSHFLGHTPGIPSPLGKAVQRKMGLQGQNLPQGCSRQQSAPSRPAVSGGSCQLRPWPVPRHRGESPSCRGSSARGFPGRDGGPPEVAKSPPQGTHSHFRWVPKKGSGPFPSFNLLPFSDWMPRKGV